MIDVTIFYPDSDTTSSGQFYLPGEPLPAHTAMLECAMECGELISYSHSHEGVILDTSDLSGTEAMHLRCVTDMADQYNTIGIQFGNVDIATSTSKHAAV